MKALRNQEGIVLITTLMMTLIALAMTLALLYMVTQGAKSSGMQKRYRTALEASYGGTEMVTKAVIPFVLQNYSSPNLIGKLTGSSGFSSVNLQVGVSQACLQAKLMKGTNSWPSGCDAVAPAFRLPDLTLQMQSTAGAPFMVYAKIVETKPGNTDMGGIALEGAGVAEGSNVILPQHQPYLYKMEVQGQRQGDTSVSSDLEVEYAY